MRWEESRNRNTLICYDVDKRNEPSNHLEFEEIKERTRDYNNAIRALEGWQEVSSTQRYVTLRRNYPEIISFENRIWQLFYKMGFTFLNKRGSNTFCYGSGENQELRFSIIGLDEDEYSFIVLDCFNNQETLDSKLRIMEEEFDKISEHLNSIDRTKNVVFNYIIAIKGFELTNESSRFIETQGYSVLTELDVEYFEDLYKSLKDAAKYQFCGKLFEGKAIPKLSTKIPAIRGRMGGNRYYAFSIDPKILLRLSFVLHKTKAHEEAMPTYQRLVKRSRLISITEFLNQGGFFPNSIVINLDEECNFHEVKNIEDDDVNIDTEIGYLEIPQKYRVAYIIDGQHRLMGYAGCVKANQQIPVVAFEKLNKPRQVKLFMEMNENQKAVPKELRLTLEKDLFPTDPRPSVRFEGLKRQIAFSFTDNRRSPLYGFVGNGIDRGEFTLDYFLQALNYSAPVYYGTIRRGREELINPGVFFRGDVNNEDCFEKARVNIRDLLFECVTALVSRLEGKETLENQDRRNVFIRNIGVNGYLRFIADLVNYKKDEILLTIDNDALSADAKDVYEIIEPSLMAVLNFVDECSPEEGRRLKQFRGAAAPIQYQRSFQRELRKIDANFNIDGLDDWIAANSSEVIEQALDIINKLKALVYHEFTERFSRKDVIDWVLDSLPDDIKRACRERQQVSPGQYDTLWGYVKEEDYYKIACYDSNDPLIKEDFLLPNTRRNARADRRYKWIREILTIEGRCIEDHICEPQDQEKLKTIYNHFVGKNLIAE